MSADADRCPASEQLTMTPNPRPSPCPVCRAPVATIRDSAGRTVLAEHRRGDRAALTIDLWSMTA